MNVIYDKELQRLPIFAWADPSAIEEGCMVQARNLANLPFAVGKVCLMPDTHTGYGMPIGGVLATKGYVIPNAVGKDIGCGMIAFKTNLTVEQFMPKRHEILNKIQRNIPTGFAHRDKAVTNGRYAHIFEENVPFSGIIQQELNSASKQLGTLGGGNHFIEAQKDQHGQVWFMLHSGSRNLGSKVCDYYDAIAQKVNTRYFSSVPKEWQLAFLPTDVAEGQEYIEAMNFCLLFAKTNRQMMADIIADVLWDVFPDGWLNEHESRIIIDVHHNYAVYEHHDGQNVIVHRKGAVKADGPLIIPGSMGSKSYIGIGKANSDSFISCSHGAGRAMGRKAAMKAIPAEAVLTEMKEKDIELFKPKKGDVAEECRAAYKDIDIVMAQQQDLVDIVYTLSPLGVIKA